jgi:hypothetical protein
MIKVRIRVRVRVRNPVNSAEGAKSEVSWGLGL